MEVLFGERGNSFISFFQQSSGRTTLGSGTETEQGDCPASNQTELRAFVSFDRKQLRVNKRMFVGSGGREKDKDERRDPENR